MNSLFGIMAGILAICAVVLFVSARHVRMANRALTSVILVATLCAASVAVYAAFGRMTDWQTQKVDEEVSAVLIAQVSDAQRRVMLKPQDVQAREQLAQAQYDLGDYAQTIATIDELIATGQASTNILGLKVNALYYRDGRRISQENRALIEQVLQKDRFEIRTCMLLGQDAYLRGDFDQAIAQWQALLDSGRAFTQENALRNAIRNAEMNRAQKEH